MNIRINGNELKKVLVGTSKDKHREVLHCLHIERVGDNIEFAATDGCVLVVQSRPISVYSDEIPKNFKLTIDLTNYKINEKYIYNIVEDNGKLYFIGPNIEAIINPFAGVFPNYHTITNGFEDYPTASEFAMFSDKAMAKWWKVFDQGVNLTPKAQNKNSPHYWVAKKYNSVWVVVLMPMRQ